MTDRSFSDINFRRDFNRRMTANEHDQSFDAFVRELRRSSQSVDLNLGHTTIALDAIGASPLNPNGYTGDPGRHTELRMTASLGLAGTNERAVVETYRSGSTGGDTIQIATVASTGAQYVRHGTNAGNWETWRQITTSTEADAIMPIGGMMMWPSATIPARFAVRNGQALNRIAYATLFNILGTTYGAGNGSTTFNIMDDRGLFERALDLGKGYDGGRTLGSEQDSDNKSHTHYEFANAGSGGGPLQNNGERSPAVSHGGGGQGQQYGIQAPAADTPATIGKSSTSGGSESRPRNRAYYPIIRII